jgi:hypothetical protein
MSESMEKTLVLEKYRCRKCGRNFYINKDDKEAWDLDFGCVFGCDDNGRHVRDIRIETKDARGERR